MRSATVLTASILLGLAAPAGMDAAQAAEQAQPKLHCDSQTAGGDTQDISCPLHASGASQRFRFKANFSGGHDDTMASMQATLDARPLDCEKGSKTSLMGEDGDVNLECKFSITENAGTQHVLRMTLSWRHAQYTDFEFDSD
jgi:hypothetical protein